jgi:hypothetical protein
MVLREPWRLPEASMAKGSYVTFSVSSQWYFSLSMSTACDAR